MPDLFIALAIIAVAHWFFRSPLCQATADAIRERGGAGGVPAVEVDERMRELTEELREEVRALRAEVAELGERVDFTERALVALRDRAALP